MRRQRLTALATLVLLQVSTVTAGLCLTVVGAPAARQQAPELPRWPTVAGAEPALAGVSTGRPPPEGVADALRPLLSAGALGGAVAAAVADPVTGDSLFSQRADVLTTPASTMKIATGVTALTSLDPTFRIETRAVRAGPPTPEPGAGAAGAAASEEPVILIGGGDPTLASPVGAATASYPEPAELADLADATVRALSDAGITATRVAYDDSLYTGPTTAPGWKSNYVPEGSVAPVTALSVDGGRIDPDRRARAQDPSAAAAEKFAELLERGGITILGPVAREVAPAGARELAAVASPPLPALVEHMLSESDNDLAEALARQVAINEGQPASFAGASTAVRDVLGRLGVADGMTIVDGSGLSTENRLTAATLSRLLNLAAAPERPRLRPAVTGLPVAGFSGTLSHRYDGAQASSGAGTVRAKTGTLNGVSSLAGVVRSADGQLLAFAFLADDVRAGGTLAAEAALDRLAAALADCGCG